MSENELLSSFLCVHFLDFHLALIWVVALTRVANYQHMAAKASSLLIGICAILQAYAVAQTTTTLPQPEVYADGKFFSPNTLRAQIYSPGSTMRISWETTFKSIHLYLVYDEDYNSAFPLISEYCDLLHRARLITDLQEAARERRTTGLWTTRGTTLDLLQFVQQTR